MRATFLDFNNGDTHLSALSKGVSYSCAWFPLTPALSPGEREDRCQSVCESQIIELDNERQLLFLLPKGGGRGEGERNVPNSGTEQHFWDYPSGDSA